MKTITIEIPEGKRAEWINGADLSYAKAFKDGAVWADANPNWHKCPDELPDEEGLYLAIRGGFYILLCWNPDNHCWDDYEEDDFVCSPTGVIAWMELPQPPKFD